MNKHLKCNTVRLLILLAISFLASCDKDDLPYDPKIPMVFPCGFCDANVSQRDERCNECDFLVSNTISKIREKNREDSNIDREKRREEEIKAREEKELEIIKAREERMIEEIKVREKRLLDTNDFVKKEFNIRVAPGSQNQATFLEIFDSYLLQTLGRKSSDFAKEELKEIQTEFVKRIKNESIPTLVKVRNSEIDCSCSLGKVVTEIGRDKVFVQCPKCNGTGKVIGIIEYRLFYSMTKNSGIQK